jgi:hypothetical protein
MNDHVSGRDVTRHQPALLQRSRAGGHSFEDPNTLRRVERRRSQSLGQCGVRRQLEVNEQAPIRPAER